MFCYVYVSLVCVLCSLSQCFCYVFGCTFVFVFASLLNFVVAFLRAWCIGQNLCISCLLHCSFRCVLLCVDVRIFCQLHDIFIFGDVMYDQYTKLMLRVFVFSVYIFVCLEAVPMGRSSSTLICTQRYAFDVRNWLYRLSLPMLLFLPPCKCFLLPLYVCVSFPEHILLLSLCWMQWKSMGVANFPLIPQETNDFERLGAEP